MNDVARKISGAAMTSDSQTGTVERLDLKDVIRS
jgi:hypothetical protein